MSKDYKFEPMTLEHCRRQYKPEATQEDVDEVNRLMLLDWQEHVSKWKDWDRRKALPTTSMEALRSYST